MTSHSHTIADVVMLFRKALAFITAKNCFQRFSDNRSVSYAEWPRICTRLLMSVSVYAFPQLLFVVKKFAH
jgi:hypothetical protein